MRLKDRTAVVTGGASGIGKAIATRFAAEGANVYIGDILETKAKATVAEIVGRGQKAACAVVDVSKSDQMKKFIESAVKEYGRLDILVNNAGVAILGEIPDISEEQWDKIMNVNLKSVFLACKYAIPIMKSAGGGAIINIGSVAGIQGMSCLGAYSASKGAISLLTKCLALDHGVNKIRVNAICPGAIQMPTRPGSPIFDQLAERKPLHRSGHPEEVANVAVFLASEEASYMTGSLVVVDGGETAGATVMM